MNFTTIVLISVIALILYFIVIYNKFISLRAGIDASESDIDVQLKRRFNLIPALVDAVKGYKKHESETLSAVIKARQLGQQAQTMGEKTAAANMLSSALGKVFALSEAYPDLKASSNFLQLQNELVDLEGTIQKARRYYNAIVRDYNAKIDSFPDLFIARNFSFQPREYFELEESESAQIRKMPILDL
jgi:LemA protein